MRKTRLIPRFMTSQPGKETIKIHILHNILRSKDNHIIKFGQLIKYNRKIIFLEKRYKKCAGDIIPRTFPKKSKLCIDQ